MDAPTSPDNLPERIEPDASNDASLDPLDMFGGGGLDLGSLMGVAQQMSEQMAEAQGLIAATQLEGSAGGGLVRVVATGSGQFVSVHISADAVDPDDLTMLEDLMLAALHDVGQGIAELQAQASPMGGLDLGGLFGG
jgi:DNA-binding YbaB/EbfC family protein